VQRIGILLSLLCLAGVSACDGPVPTILAERSPSQPVPPYEEELPSGLPPGPVQSFPHAPGDRGGQANTTTQQRSPGYPQEFQVTSMRGTSHVPAIRGNTVQALRAAHRQGIKHVEVDLYQTLDGVLVTTHEPGVKRCGDVRAMNSAPALGCRGKGGLRVATLSEVLQIPFESIYLDLKETKRLERAERAVRAAAEAIVAADRADDAVMMVYQAPSPVLRIIRRHSLRAGLKGYPLTEQDAELLVHQASALGLEMACLKAEHLTAALVRDSIDLGVWHLPWSVNRAELPHWRELAEAGAGGLIVLHYAAARERVAPHWVDRWRNGRNAGAEQGT
jgi:glycerophosphoryl diester phosphodiesterase